MNLVHMCVHRQIFIEYSWTNVWDYTELSLTLWSDHTGDHQTLFQGKLEVREAEMFTKIHIVRSVFWIMLLWKENQNVSHILWIRLYWLKLNPQHTQCNQPNATFLHLQPKNCQFFAFPCRNKLQFWNCIWIGCVDHGLSTVPPRWCNFWCIQ